MISRCSTLILFLLCAISATMAQPTAPANRKAKLTLYGSPDPLMVAISELKNTSIVFTSFASDQEGAVLAQEIPISEINYLRYPAKNGTAARAFVGGLVGFGIGGMIGLLMGDDDACTLPANV